MILLALMQELASEDSQASLLHLQRHEILLVVVHGMAHLVLRDPVEDFRAFVELSLVTARKAPETAIVDGGVLEGDPEAEEGIGIGIEVSRVLMDIDFSTNLGRLQDGHGLHHQWFFNAQLVTELFHSVGVGDVLEELVVLMQGVTYLVDGLALGDGELAVLPRFGLEEVADLAGRVQEVLAKPVGALARLAVEDGDLLGGRFEAVDKSVDFIHGFLAGVGRDELGDERVSVLLQKLCRFLDFLCLHLNAINQIIVLAAFAKK